MKIELIRLTCLLIALFALAATARAQGTTFTYQGRLAENGAVAGGIYDLRFTIYDALSAGNVVSGVVTNAATSVSNGVFTVALDFGANAFDGNARWLEIGVRTNGGGAFVTLNPRQPITATPYALHANSANSTDLAAAVTGMQVNTNLSSTALGFNTTASGSASTALGLGSQASGLASTAMGNNTLAIGLAATAMGRSTLASGSAAFAAGRDTAAGGDYSTALGRNTTASGLDATALGYQTIASGAQATAIGQSTTAGGIASLAAGTQSRANHDGSFVWADYNFVEFNSTATNQFLIRAAGGVGINNNNPNGAALAVNGHVNVEGIISANAVSAASVTTPEVITPKLRTSANVPLEIYVNSQRGLRLEPTANEDTVNVIGGSGRNFVGAGVVGATIGGGGSGIFGASSSYTNQVGGNFGTVSGGFQNAIQSGLGTTIGGGAFNTIQSVSQYATIGGGRSNTIQFQAAYQTIGGGRENTIQNNGGHSTIGGGRENTIQPSVAYSTISGGHINTIQSLSEYATIPGGQWNNATSYAFAAGRRAKANHIGAFVWADSTDADFASTRSNQFLIRASGGVGVGTRNPQGSLHVYSTNNPTVVRVQSTGAPGAARLEFVSNPQGDVNEWRPGFIESTDSGGFTGGLTFNVNGTGAGSKFGNVEVMRIVNGSVGIGTINPQSALQVIGTVTATAFNPPSDRNLKENFTPVSPREVLEKISALPISRWNFKGDAATPHVGPMAQDFHAAFGLGTDDKHIATVDADGVALAAIQGLNQKLNEELKRRDAENAELKQELGELKLLVSSLAHKLNGDAK